MKKMFLIILALIGLSQTLHATMPAETDWQSMQAELALLKKLNAQKTDARFSNYPVLPPISKKTSAPCLAPEKSSGKHRPRPRPPTQPPTRKHRPRPAHIIFDRTYTKFPSQRKKWSTLEKDREELLTQLRKIKIK